MSSNTNHEHWPVVWVRSSDTMPDTCLTCGMFTDQRGRATLLEAQVKMVNAGGTPGSVAFGCLLHLLGPVGWIIGALLLHSQGEKQQVAKTTTSKLSIRIPQCRLCRGVESLEPLQRSAAGRFAFHAHPKFRQRFEEANANPAE